MQYTSLNSIKRSETEACTFWLLPVGVTETFYATTVDFLYVDFESFSTKLMHYKIDEL